ATPGGPTVTPTPPAPTVTATPTGVPTPVPTAGGHLCGDAPRSGCLAPVKSRGALLTITKGASPDKDRIQWKWAKGPLVAKADFGIPLSATDYELCIYDGNDTHLVR